MKSYADMSGDEFKQTFSGLICKLMYQIEGGIEPLDVFTDLKQITRDSPFLDDIERFFQLSKSERNSTNIESMKLIHERIFAVLDEHYEDAAKITKRLRELGFKG